jgi:hypothetical protein
MILKPPARGKQLPLHGNLIRDSAVERQALQTYAGQAFFGGTGPVGKTCGGCSFWDGKPTSRAAICLMHKRMRDGRAGPIVPRQAAACKYFEMRPEPDAAESPPESTAADQGDDDRPPWDEDEKNPE